MKVVMNYVTVYDFRTTPLVKSRKRVVCRGRHVDKLELHLTSSSKIAHYNINTLKPNWSRGTQMKISVNRIISCGVLLKGKPNN